MKFLCCSDLHIRYDRPVNRVDNFMDIQRATLEQIKFIAVEQEAFILISGDIFHRARPLNPQYLENLLFDIFKDIRVCFVAGQHDLVNHSMGNFDKGSIGVVSRFSNWYNCWDIRFTGEAILWSFNWNEKLKEPGLESKKCQIMMLHKFVSDQPLPPWMKGVGIEAKDLCEKFPDYNLFICGDNHKGFEYLHPETNQLVLNCGTITRQSLTEKNYKPRVYIYDTETRKYEIKYLLDDQDNVFREDLKKQEREERENRIDSFIELAGSRKEITWNFEENIKSYCEKNNIPENVRVSVNNVIRECYEN